MTEGIIIALITAGGAIIVAIINKFVGKKGSPGKATDSKTAVVNQKAKGNGTTQIGIQINRNEGDEFDG